MVTRECGERDGTKLPHVADGRCHLQQAANRVQQRVILCVLFGYLIYQIFFLVLWSLKRITGWTL